MPLDIYFDMYTLVITGIIISLLSSRGYKEETIQMKGIYYKFHLVNFCGLKTTPPNQYVIEEHETTLKLSKTRRK